VMGKARSKNEAPTEAPPPPVSLYASAFLGRPVASSGRDEVDLAWAGLHWDLTERTATIVAVAAPPLAKRLRKTHAAGPDGLAAMQASVAHVRAELIALDRAAVQASGIHALDRASHHAVVETLCAMAWAACAGSYHGAAWRAARAILPASALPRTADASVLGRLAARTATWRQFGAQIVDARGKFDRAAAAPVFAEAVATIGHQVEAFVSTF
jgi:hypothetical protein